jgi:hypothetical protein
MSFSNQDIINFVKKNFGNASSLSKEIDIILNNLLETKCSIPYSITFPYTVLGVSISSNSNRSLNLCIITPNLFRLCFVQNKLYIPNICPIFDDKNKNTKYIPLLLDKKTIQSFLYYGFSTNIYKYPPPTSISDTYLIDKLIPILNSKDKTNYGFYTSATEIFIQIYPKDCLLIQVLQFNKGIKNALNSFAKNSVIANYSIPWKTTSICLCTSGIINDTIILEANKILSRLDLIAINNFNVGDKSRYYGLPNETNSISKNIILNNSIYQIISYALEVYTDILEQIEYFILNKKYCLKNYMQSSNIPKLLKYYNNYVNIQTNIDNNYSNSSYNNAV